MNFFRYLSKRLLLAVITIFGVLTIVFILTHILPGNPALVKVGQFADEATIKAMEKEMGLDKPLIVQYGNYLGQVLQGNLGNSWTTGQPVNKDLAQRIPATVELALISLFIAVIIGLPLGIFAAVKGGWIDRLMQGISILGVSTPVFWLGLMLIYIFYYQLNIAPPPTGRLDDLTMPPTNITGLYIIDSLLTGNFATLKAAILQLILPAITLAFVIIAPIAKMSRDSMIKVLQADYIQSARALGVSGNEYVFKDALRNAMIPVLTTLGIVLGYLIAGSVLIEMIFSWPGIGIYVWQALMSNDFNSIQGVVLVIAVSYVFINLVVDILYSIVDPRIRLH
ncbi:ABC transporter permease [Alkalihalobacterium alkalinitrilicum]|uniref:ABC transporter permease n=1 Tax=Alkalihalobacterium alkalinitrilicum TaxID=427920 RepID=UPI000995AEBD|nr:ABC transporter permease [Alkalihalobacterium alkalinitrilicum]